MAVKFIEGDPPIKKGRRGSLAPIRADLRANPGVWAEVDRGPKWQARTLTNRGLSLIKNGGPDLQYAVRQIGDETVLFARAVSA
ncbi:MAG: hypothetical protein ACO1ON_13080 [Nocardioides sp.]